MLFLGCLFIVLGRFPSSLSNGGAENSLLNVVKILHVAMFIRSLLKYVVLC